MHNNIRMILQKIATISFSAVGSFLHVSSFMQKKTELLWKSKNGQHLSAGRAMLTMLPSGYMAGHLSILSS